MTEEMMPVVSRWILVGVGGGVEAGDASSTYCRPP